MDKLFLKEWRNYRKLSVRALERESGVSLASIVRLEGGRRKNPRIDTLEKLGDALGITPFDLYKPPPKKGQRGKRKSR